MYSFRMKQERKNENEKDGIIGAAAGEYEKTADALLAAQGKPDGRN